jgi:dTDP-4-dehydrorhamnose 3,5-epimerase
MFEQTGIEGLLIFTPKVFEDERGFFMESYTKSLFEKNGINIDFVQDNHSKSSFGVLRGLHFQAPPFAQAKLIRALQGTILDVAVDLRKNSKTFGKHLAIELNQENKKQLLIPSGFAHGFVVLSETCEVAYKTDNYYNKESDGGLFYGDPQLNIDWKISSGKIILSEKDKKQPLLKDFDNSLFIY